MTLHGPGQALDLHVRLYDDVRRTCEWAEANHGRLVQPENIPRLFAQRATLISASTKTMLIEGDHTLAQERLDTVGTRANVLRTAALLRYERELLNEGATWYISQAIAETVASFAKVAEPEPLFETDMPAANGLIVLETPILLDDLDPDTGEQVEGLHMPIRAIGWQQHKVGMPNPDTGEVETVKGIAYYLYTLTEDWKHWYIPACRELLGDEEAELNELSAARTEWCFLSDHSGWAYGVSWQRTDSVQDSRPGYVPDSVSYMRRWLLALFRFTWQQILVGHTHHPTRAERRRFERVKQTVPQDGYIKIVRLRREIEAEARGERCDSDTMSRNHQWLVRGHPRRQWYPKLGPARTADGTLDPMTHRLIWIEAHTAGNPFGELVHGHAVVAVIR